MLRHSKKSSVFSLVTAIYIKRLSSENLYMRSKVAAFGNFIKENSAG
jgi:hypothetical protein